MALIKFNGKVFKGVDIMNAKELIDILKTMPQDVEVLCEDPVIGHYIPIHSIKHDKEIILTNEKTY